MQNKISDGYILVDGPSWGDTQFIGQWLLAVHRANEIWNRVAQDFCFYRRVEALELIYRVDSAQSQRALAPAAGHIPISLIAVRHRKTVNRRAKIARRMTAQSGNSRKCRKYSPSPACNPATFDAGANRRC
jgi:hypothetical protein